MVKKRYIYAIITLLILVIGIFTIYAAVDTDKAWHSPNEVLVTVDGYTMTLQNATDNNVFIDGATQSFTTEIPSSGHNFSEIWISIDGNEKTLQDALSISNDLCGSFTTSYSSAPSSLAYHFASEIEISPGTSLQDAIDKGDFCSSCVPDCNVDCQPDGCGEMCPCLGYILIPGNAEIGTSDFYVMKYEAKNINSKPVSQEAVKPWVDIYFNVAKDACVSLGSGYHLLTTAERITIARSIESTPASWTGEDVGSGMVKRGNVGINDDGSYDGANPEYGTGRNTKAELTLSNGETIWDFSGNVEEWVDGVCTPGTGNGFWYTQRSEWSNENLSDFERLEAGPSSSIDYGLLPSDKGVGTYFGCLYDNSINVTPAFTATHYRFALGGHYLSRSNAGIFHMVYDWDTRTKHGGLGFRCAKSFDEYTYLWDIGLWSNCEDGGGTATRIVYCKRNDGVQVLDNYCAGTKPPITQKCWSGDVWSSSCPWGLPCWKGKGCSSCPWGTKFSDSNNIYCKTNGKQGTWKSIFSGDDWRRYRFSDYSAKCCCTSYTGNPPFYNSRWRIID